MFREPGLESQPSQPKAAVNDDTLWLFNIAMENDPFIDDVPIKSDYFPWLC